MSCECSGLSPGMVVCLPACWVKDDHPAQLGQKSGRASVTSRYRIRPVFVDNSQFCQVGPQTYWSPPKKHRDRVSACCMRHNELENGSPEQLGRLLSWPITYGGVVPGNRETPARLASVTAGSGIYSHESRDVLGASKSCIAYTSRYTQQRSVHRQTKSNNGRHFVGLPILTVTSALLALWSSSLGQ